jgi:hypothetical protein
MVVQIKTFEVLYNLAIKTEIKSLIECQVLFETNMFFNFFLFYGFSMAGRPFAPWGERALFCVHLINNKIKIWLHANIYNLQHTKKWKKLSLNGFTYTRRRSEDSIIFWRCSNRKCRGSAKTNGENATELINHNHEPSFMHRSVKFYNKNSKNVL